MPIELKNVSYTYAPGTAYSAQALKNVSLRIDDGEYVGIIGRTGCGKSTLIQLMAGLLEPDEGEVLFDGADINSRDYDRGQLRARLGMVFQFPEYQLFETTVERDVAFGLKHSGLSAKEKEQAVRQALATVGFDFDKVRGKSPLGFSGGEKRRIAIAGVLAAGPKVLILDEPIAGLDPLGREDFLRMTDELNASGVTVIMISHNCDALAEHASRILMLHDGCLVRDGSMREVFSDCAALHADGISPGQVRETVEMLRERGIMLPQSTVRYSELMLELKRRFGRAEQ